MNRPVTALTIAGSDPSGGAGIQADIKTFSALGAYATSVLTALTAQSTQGVSGVQTLPPEFVTEQLETLVADVAIDTVKIGMLADAPTARAVGDFLHHNPGIDTVVFDPVMVSASGSRLLADEAVAAVRELMPQVSVIIPNLAEAAVLLDEEEADSLDKVRRQAPRLRAAGAHRVMVTGGHLSDDDAIDVWADAAGERLLSQPRVATHNTHGTGCSLSSALAALAPPAESWPDAAEQAKAWLRAALQAGDQLDIGQGPGPVHHFYQLWQSP